MANPPKTLKETFVKNPASDFIAKVLNVEEAKVCEHKRNPCYLRCGVCRATGKKWEAIPLQARLDWLTEVLDPKKFDSKKGG